MCVCVCVNKFEPPGGGKRKHINRSRFDHDTCVFLFPSLFPHPLWFCLPLLPGDSDQGEFIINSLAVNPHSIYLVAVSIPILLLKYNLSIL